MLYQLLVSTKGKIKSFESNIKLDCGAEFGSSRQFLSGYIRA